MKRKFLKWSVCSVALFLVLATSVPAIALFVRGEPKFTVPYPEIHASRDPAVIARGRYLANGPAHCGECHADPAGVVGGSRGPDAPLSGGFTFRLPIGDLRTPNITSDPQTGIGRYRDQEIARLLRDGVHPSGRAMLPFMPYANMSDEDLTAVISYLRTLAPVRKAIAPLDFNLLGRLVQAFVLEPNGPAKPPSRNVPTEPSAAYGRYLAHDVANCVGCHTRRDLRTGAFTGPALGGGMVFDRHGDSGLRFVSVNLTPDPATGRITGWSEDAFVQRFRGAQATPSPMPWSSFARMSEDDLRALYRYLRSVPPVRMPEES